MTLYEVAQKEGEKRNQEKVVRNMLQKGLDYETIASYTDLSVDEVKLLAKKTS